MEVLFMRKYCNIFVLICALVSVPSAFAGEKWRLVSHAVPGTTQFQLSEIFCDTVNTLSNGELTIEPYAAGVLFPVFDTFDNLANGVVEIGMVYAAYWTGKDSAFNLTTRPGCPINTYAEGAYLDEKLEPFTKKLYAKYSSTKIPYQLLRKVPENKYTF
jgi:TRAP-type mannitol/chloroaromatic compound transport system substrate-binding protein